MSHSIRLLIHTFLLSVLLTGGSALAQSKKDQEIDVRLFGKTEVDRSKGCSVALWQANRDPEADAFAYIFVEMLGADHVRQPARMKIGKDVISLQRVATGGRTSGYDLHEYQLYKMAAEHSFVVLQLTLGDIEGEAVDIDNGWLTVYQPSKLPARIAVKGGAGCMTPAAPAPGKRGGNDEDLNGMAGRHHAKLSAIRSTN